MATAGSERIVGPGITVVCIDPIPNIREGPDNQIEIVFVDDVVIQHLTVSRCKVRSVVIFLSAGARIARRIIIRSYRLDRIRMMNTYAEVAMVAQQTRLRAAGSARHR